MTSSTLNRWRLLAVVALVALLQPAATALIADETGREFARCIRTCNEIRKVCGDRCSVDCGVLFPNNRQQRDACIAACKDICASESNDCKLVCKTGEPPTIEEP